VALLCALVAWPVAAAPKADKAGGQPPGLAKKGGSAPGQAKKAAKGSPGHAKKGGAARGQAKKNGGTPPGQAKKAASAPARAQGGTPPGQAEKAARAQGGTPPGQAKKAGKAVTGGAAPNAPAAGGPSAGRDRSAAARRRAARQRAVARRRAAAAARRRAAARAARRERAVRQTRAAEELGAPGTPAPADGGAPDTSLPTFAGDDPAEARARRERPGFVPVDTPDDPPQPLRVVRDIVEVVPTAVRVLLAGLAALALLLGAAYVMTLLRNRRLGHQRRVLLDDVGLLQTALLPEVPATLAASRASVAYRPADGPGAGGDFYDILPLAGGRTAILIGDVSGHGRSALARTALARYTLRAYIEAGMEPQESLQIAGSVLAGKLQGDFVTALIAVHDAAAGTLTYAAAGHPAPIVIAGRRFEPVVVGTAPPLGVGSSTGQRQTTVPFPRGAIACFYTDGLTDARTDYGRLGADRLERLVRELGPEVTAERVIDTVAQTAGKLEDDAAVCVLVSEGEVAVVRPRIERLEVTRSELRGPLLRAFLDACGVAPRAVRAAQHDAREMAHRAGAAVAEVRIDDRAHVEVRAPDVAIGDEAPVVSGADRPRV
jgi:serine phosphatase RsbU (regulator of sigma subunit)